MASTKSAAALLAAIVLVAAVVCVSASSVTHYDSPFENYSGYDAKIYIKTFPGLYLPNYYPGPLTFVKYAIGKILYDVDYALGAIFNFVTIDIYCDFKGSTVKLTNLLIPLGKTVKLVDHIVGGVVTGVDCYVNGLFFGKLY